VIPLFRSDGPASGSRPLTPPGLLATLALAAIAACGDDEDTRIDIDLDVPADDADGALLGDLDSLEFRVSDGRAFVSTQLQRIEGSLPSDLRLSDVPTGEEILFDLSGLDGDALVAYGRTCRLTIDSDDSPISALLYFSRVGRFRTGREPLVPARRAGLMFTDDQGRAVVTGGSADSVVVELFDPRQGSFTEHGEATSRLAGAVAVRADGTAVLAGGVDADGELVGTVEEFNPGSQALEERVVRLGPERQAEAERTGHAMAALADGGVLLTGGRSGDGTISSGIALLDEGDDQFRPATSLTRPRTFHTATVGLSGLGGVTYVIGGISTDEAGAELVTGSIELYRAQDQEVRAVMAELARPRFGHTATVMADGSILVVGGKTAPAEGCADELEPEACFDAVAEVELFDPIVGEVRAVDAEDFGAVHDHTATLLTGGRVLIAGGSDSTGAPRSDAWLFDPQLEALVPTRPMSRARARHTATELCDGTVLLVGGDTQDGQPPPAERYAPASDRLP
jgi:hypothetical protein